VGSFNSSSTTPSKVLVWHVQVTAVTDCWEVQVLIVLGEARAGSAMQQAAQANWQLRQLGPCRLQHLPACGVCCVR
jgi:hypothetical protein